MPFTVHDVGFQESAPCLGQLRGAGRQVLVGVGNHRQKVLHRRPEQLVSAVLAPAQRDVHRWGRHGAAYRRHVVVGRDRTGVCHGPRETAYVHRRVRQPQQRGINITVPQMAGGISHGDGGADVEQDMDLVPDEPPGTPHALQRRLSAWLGDGHGRDGVKVGDRRGAGEVEHRLPHPGHLQGQVGTRQRSITQVFQTAVDDQDTVQGSLLVRQLHLTDPEERLTGRLRRHSLTGHGRSQSGQRGCQLTCSRGGLPQHESPLDRSGMGRHPGQYVCGPFRLGIDPRAQSRDGPPASGLTEDSDSRMTGNR